MSRFPFFSFKEKSERLNSLDFKLVKQTQTQSVPGLTQLKYLIHFLNKKEKIAFFSLTAIAILSCMGLFGLYLGRHITSEPSEGGEYTEGLIGQPKFINPVFSIANDVDQDLASLIYTGLFSPNKDQKLEPEIAHSYTVSEDGKVYDIKLKEDVRFADGELLTSRDVIFTIELIQNPEVGSPLFSAFQGVKVEALDEFAVRFTLKTPFAPFLQNLTVGILPEHIWINTNINSIRLAGENLQPLGSGPWKFSKMMKSSTGKIDSITLSKNEYYFKDQPYLKTLRFKFFDEYGQAMESLKSQSIDSLSFIPHSQSVKLNNKNIGVYSMQLPQYTALFFNQNNEQLLKDFETRTALAKSIRKDELISSALQGFAEPINSPLLPGYLGYNSEGKKISIDFDEANTLLDKKWTRIEPEEYFKLKYDELLKKFKPETPSSTVSSTTSTSEIETITTEDDNIEERINQIVREQMDPDQSFYRKDKNNKILEFTISTADTEEYTKAANFIAKEWAKIGVKANVEKIGVNRLVRDVIKNRNYQILLYGEIIGSDPDPYPFWHSSQADHPGLNLSGFSNRTADKLLEDGRATLDENKRNEYYEKFHNILIEEIPAIFLYTPVHSLAANKAVNGIDIKFISSPSNRFDDLGNWYIKTKLKWK